MNHYRNDGPYYNMHGPLYTGHIGLFGRSLTRDGPVSPERTNPDMCHGNHTHPCPTRAHTAYSLTSKVNYIFSSPQERRN